MRTDHVERARFLLEAAKKVFPADVSLGSYRLNHDKNGAESRATGSNRPPTLDTSMLRMCAISELRVL